MTFLTNMALLWHAKQESAGREFGDTTHLLIFALHLKI